MIVSAYTDGSCNPHSPDKFGAYAVVFVARKQDKSHMKTVQSKRYSSTTIARMELKAIIRVLEHCEVGHTIDVYSDSKFCVDAINQWLDGWIHSGKINSKANPELWFRFLKEKKRHIENGSTLNFSWVRGHGENPFNQKVDKAAVNARMEPKNGTVHCKENN